MTPQAKLKAIKELTGSKGWAVLLDVMNAEILASAMSIAESANMDLTEINFRRGSIWAAKRMLELPVRLQSKLESEIALSDMDDRNKNTGNNEQ